MKTMLSLTVGCAVVLSLAADAPRPAPKKPPESPAISDKHYAVFDARGNPSSLDAIAERLSGVSVVFLGEHHNDPVAHHLELVLFKRAAEQASRLALPPGATARPVALAVEMFE